MVYRKYSGNFAAIVKAARIKKGVSIFQAAEDIGINRTVISAVENSRFLPAHLKLICLLADYYQMDINILLEAYQKDCVQEQKKNIEEKKRSAE